MDGLSRNKVIGETLRNLRVETGKTIAEVSETLGVSESALRMYELGQRVPRDEIKERVAHFYGQSIAFIFYPECHKR